MKKFILLLMLLMLPLVQAATISGNVYDFSLNKVQAIVSINTEPKQQIVTQGTYQFEVPPGKYELIAEQKQTGTTISKDNESIIVTSDGIFVIDLILFPIDESEKLLEDINTISFPEDNVFIPNTLAIIALLGLIILATISFFVWKRKPKKIDKNLQKIIDFLQEHEGRTTQKEIRKQFPLSEAKISLMIAELEESGIIKKIKKGRGNIIVLT